MPRQKSAKNRPELADYVRLVVTRPLPFALVAAMSAEEAVERFDLTFQLEYDVRDRFVRRLKESCDQDPTNHRHVRNLIEKIEGAVDQLPTRKQRSADATIIALAFALPPEEQLAIATESVLHPRRPRRSSGYRLTRTLRKCDVSTALTRSYLAYGDPEALRTLVLIGADISGLPDVGAAVASLTDRYHQARAIESLLVNDRAAAAALADDFPIAFIWAAGRRRDLTARDFVVRHFERLMHDLESVETHSVKGLIELTSELPWLVWALGRVGATEQLTKLAIRYQIDSSLIQ